MQDARPAKENPVFRASDQQPLVRSKERAGSASLLRTAIWLDRPGRLAQPPMQISEAEEEAPAGAEAVGAAVGAVAVRISVAVAAALAAREATVVAAAAVAV
jgi:hypothetical protein